MPNIFASIFADTTMTTTLTITQFLISTFSSLVFGICIAFIYSRKNKCGKSFLITLALLPLITQVVIILVNGNLGTGIAVMGAFNLVRFRSIPGNASDITSIFLAMAMGLATGMGYIGFAAVFLIIYAAAYFVLMGMKFGGRNDGDRLLKVTIPENLDYNNIFDDLFERYTKKVVLNEVRTTNMGALFQLTYDVSLKDGVNEKSLIDEMRCRNGNLEIRLTRALSDPNRL